METVALDNNAENLNTVLDKYISKPSRAKDRVPSEAPRPPQLPSYLRTTSRASVRGTERRRRGGEYALSPSPRPSYAGHEELRPRPRPRHVSAPPPGTSCPPPRPRAPGSCPETHQFREFYPTHRKLRRNPTFATNPSKFHRNKTPAAVHK